MCETIVLEDVYLTHSYESDKTVLFLYDELQEFRSHLIEKFLIGLWKLTDESAFPCLERNQSLKLLKFERLSVGQS